MIIRPRADIDIDHQFEYLAIEAGLETARRFLAGLRETVTRLVEHPDIGSPRTFDDARLTGVRMWPVRGFRRHLIFYIASARQIEVVRVLHGASDIERLLRDDA